MVHMRSAVVGSSATVAVAVGVFLAVSAGNASEPAPVVVEEPALVGHYSTVESVDPIVYVPEPVAVVVEPVVEPAPEPVPAPVPVEEPVSPKPAAIPAPEVAPVAPPGVVAVYCEYPPEGYTGMLVDGLLPGTADAPCMSRNGHSENGVWIFTD